MNRVNICTELFEKWSNEKQTLFEKIPGSGSSRQYFRHKSKNKTAICVFNQNREENIAFIKLSEHFHKYNLNVPKIYRKNLNKNVYLIEDLGDKTLLNYLQEEKKKNKISNNTLTLYKKALIELTKFQLKGINKFDFSICYPTSDFDKQSIMWDLNYFKYYFLNYSGLKFNEKKLDGEFNTFSQYLVQADSEYFMYRDFQSRNIMLKDNKLYFIDYQGGRRGALQYDVASILYQSKADLGKKIREDLLEYYLSNLSSLIDLDIDLFKKYYYDFVVLRIFQVLGAYGYRGLFEKKSYFSESIPFALKNLKEIYQRTFYFSKLKFLNNIARQIFTIYNKN